MIRSIIFAAAAAFLAGCASTAPQRVTASQASIENDASTAMNRSQVVQPVRGPVVSDVPYVDVRPVRVHTTLPVAFTRTVRFNEPIGVPIQILAQRIEAQTGVRVTYQAELAEAAGEPASAPAASGMESLLAALPPIGDAGSFSSSTLPLRTGVAINYSGSLRGLFDTVAATTGAYWKYEAHTNSVNIYRYVTESFRIETVIGTSSSAASIGGSSGSGDGLSSGQATADHATSGSVWGDIEAGLSKLLSPEGVFAMSTNLGTVIVRDRPDRLEIVRDFIKEQNAALATQVSFEVNVYRVQVRDQDVKGLNWNLFFQRFIDSSPYQINFLNALANNSTNEQAVSQTIIAVKPQADGQAQRWGASNVVVEALSSLGNTSVVTSVTAVTVNNSAAPVRVTRKRAYAAEVTQGVAGQGGTAIATGSQLSPGEVETGLVMYLLPHVQSDGKRVLVKAMASLSTLERLDTFSSGEQTIQLPQVASREFQQTAWLNSGETLVLAGFEQTEGDSEASSPFDWRAWPVAGRRSVRHEREIVVITITPSVMAARSRI